MPLNRYDGRGGKGPLTSTDVRPPGPGPASPSIVSTQPSGQTWATTPMCGEDATLWGPVPYRTRSPGRGWARTGRARPWATAQSNTLPTNAKRGMGTPALSQAQVANRAHQGSQGP